MNQNYERVTRQEKNVEKLLSRFLADGIVPVTGTLQGNVPGETIEVKKELVEKADILFAEIVKQIPPFFDKNPYQRVVLTICGGSGVGKTSIAALLSHYFHQAGVGCYTLSGDNYPHRIPMYNDAERLRIFREHGIHGMLEDGVYTRETFSLIHKWQKMGDDANLQHLKEASWFASYLNAGKKGLEGYLGTQNEIAFDEVGAVVSAFKDGAEKIWLRRMGREDTELWYDCVDFRKIHILLIEWTHGNSDFYQGVDFPILLNSTPQETLAYRKTRNRDGAVDSPFTTMVLNIEQELLKKQAFKAKLILSKAGKLLDYEAYCRLMEESSREVKYE